MKNAKPKTFGAIALLFLCTAVSGQTGGDRLYALGGNGDLSSLDLRTGKVVWTMNVLSKFGGSNTKWGISESPLVIGDKVLVNAGGPGASIVALKKTDGTLIWKSQSDEA